MNLCNAFSTTFCSIVAGFGRFANKATGKMQWTNQHQWLFFDYPGYPVDKETKACIRFLGKGQGRVFGPKKRQMVRWAKKKYGPGEFLRRKLDYLEQTCSPERFDYQRVYHCESCPVLFALVKAVRESAQVTNSAQASPGPQVSGESAVSGAVSDALTAESDCDDGLELSADPEATPQVSPAKAATVPCEDSVRMLSKKMGKATVTDNVSRGNRVLSLSLPCPTVTPQVSRTKAWQPLEGSVQLLSESMKTVDDVPQDHRVDSPPLTRETGIVELAAAGASTESPRMQPRSSENGGQDWLSAWMGGLSLHHNVPTTLGLGDVKTFDSQEDFQDYFNARPKVMRALLCRYSTKEPKCIVQGPVFHFKKTSDEQVSSAFFEQFDRSTFILVNNQITLGTDANQDIVAVEDVCARLLNELEPLRKKVKSLLSGATMDHMALKEPKDPLDIAVNAVYTKIRTQVTTQVGADGGQTNCEITRHSMEKIIASMAEDFNIGENDVVVDAGCAYQVAMAHVAQVLGCRVFGIEIVRLRAFLCCHNMKEVLAKYPDLFVNLKIGYVQGDLLQYEHYGEANCLYAFDEAFTHDVMEAMLRAAHNTRNLRLIISYKVTSRKKKEFVDLFLKYGFSPVPEFDIKVSKNGGGGTNTARFYVREGQLPAQAKGPMVNSQTNDRSPEDILKVCWEGTNEERLALYSDIAREEDEKTKRQYREGAKTPERPCCMAGSWIKCPPSLGCEECLEAFRHNQWCISGQSTIHGKGLFADRNIGQGALVVEYCGKPTSKRPPRGQMSYLAKVGGQVIEPRSDCIAKYVNHSCKPNCMFRQWTETLDHGADKVRMSIETKVAVVEGEELTVNHREDYQIEECRCHHCASAGKALCLAMTFDHRVCESDDLDTNLSRVVADTENGQLWPISVARDTLRCVALKATLKGDVYSCSHISMDSAVHIQSSFANRKLVECIQKRVAAHAGDPKLAWIELDYYYCPGSYVQTYNPVFAKLGKLATLLTDGGKIVLTVTPQLLELVASHESKWSEVLEPSLGDNRASPLFLATESLDAETMRRVFHKELDQQKFTAKVNGSMLNQLMRTYKQSHLLALVDGYMSEYNCAPQTITFTKRRPTLDKQASKNKDRSASTGSPRRRRKLRRTELM